MWIGGSIVLLKVLFEVVVVDLKKWMHGYEAEQKVEDASYELPKSFIPITNIVLGGTGNIDEVIVGPTGIWVVEVKSHTGRITFDGKELRRGGELFEKDFLKQAWAERCGVRDILRKELNKDFFIHPVICFSDAEVRIGPKPVRGIYVIGLKWLNGLILKGPTRLGYSTVDEIVKILENYKE